MANFGFLRFRMNACNISNIFYDYEENSLAAKLKRWITQPTKQHPPILEYSIFLEQSSSNIETALSQEIPNTEHTNDA